MYSLHFYEHSGFFFLIVLQKNDEDVTDPRRKQKKKWSPAEVAAVMRHFDRIIKKGKTVSKVECEQCKTAEHPILENRTIQNIRDFVRNRGTTLKKKSGN